MLEMYLWAAVLMWNNSEIVSDKFPRAEIKLFQTDVDEGWNNLKFTCNDSITGQRCLQILWFYAIASDIER